MLYTGVIRGMKVLGVNSESKPNSRHDMRPNPHHSDSNDRTADDLQPDDENLVLTEGIASERPMPERKATQEVGAPTPDDIAMPDRQRDKFVAEEIDWSVSGIINHPSGMDFALAQNLALMEQQTRDLIANGSVEDILLALEENTRQMEMLKVRMDSGLDWLVGNATMEA